MEEYEERQFQKKVEGLPVGTMTTFDEDEKYRDVYIEVGERWVKIYLRDGTKHSIPAIHVEDIEWKDKRCRSIRYEDIERKFVVVFAVSI